MSNVFYKLVDIGGGFVYSLIMITLTIEQTQKILNISYPTALKFAGLHGSKIDRSDGPAVWRIPLTAVDLAIGERAILLDNMRKRRDSIVNGQQ